MSRNWLRSCSLTLSGSSTKTVTGGGPTDLRIVFTIKMWHLPSPNLAHFRVYNPSPSTRAKLRAKEFDKVEFSAGYQGNEGVVFSGNIMQTANGHETAVDAYVDIFAADDEHDYNQARVTKTLAAGWTPQDKLDVALKAMPNTTMGFNGLDLSQPKFPRGIPLIGMARDIIRQVVSSKGGLWSLQQGKLHITDKTLKGASSGPIDLNPQTGLIGWPTQTADGIVVRSLLNPALQPLQQIKLDPTLINEAEQNNDPGNPAGIGQNRLTYDLQALGAGTYTIFHMNRLGDTRGADWYDESMCIGVGGSLPPSQPGYSLGGGEAVQDQGVVTTPTVSSGGHGAA